MVLEAKKSKVKVPADSVPGADQDIGEDIARCFGG